jgi:hypothetical protein
MRERHDDEPPVIDGDKREELLRRDGLLIGVALLSLMSGMHFSPYFDIAFILFKPIAAGLFITSPLLSFYFTSLLLGIAALAISGIPAALYERMTGRSETDSRSLLIWLVGAGILAIPPAMNAVGLW